MAYDWIQEIIGVVHVQLMASANKAVGELSGFLIGSKGQENTREFSKGSVFLFGGSKLGLVVVLGYCVPH